MNDDNQIPPPPSRPMGGRRPGAGRPKGVPNKITQPIKELAAHHSAESIATLVALRDHSENDQVRLAAARELLDRAHGRPRQEADLNHDKAITVIVNRGGYRAEVLPPAKDAAVLEHYVTEEKQE
jgi:hypothetical protein